MAPRLAPWHPEKEKRDRTRSRFLWLPTRSNRRTAGLGLRLVWPWCHEALAHWDRGRRRYPRAQRRPVPSAVRTLAQARAWRDRLAAGDETQAALARAEGISPARVSQVLRLLDLEPSIVAAIESGGARVDTRDLIHVARLVPAEQRAAVEKLTAPSATKGAA